MRGADLPTFGKIGRIPSPSSRPNDSIIDYLPIGFCGPAREVVAQLGPLDAAAASSIGRSDGIRRPPGRARRLLIEKGDA